MRFLHLADLHLGKQLNGFSLAEDQAYILKQIVALACEHHVDTILIAGDIYDRALPSADAVELLDTFLTNLGAAGINVVAIPGNHDSAQRVAYGSALLAAQNIYLAKPYTGTLCPITFTDKYGDVVIWPIPFMRPAHIRPYHSDGKFGSNYSAALETMLATAPFDPHVRNIALVHQLIVSGSLSPEVSDSEITLGTLEAIDSSVLDKFDYVALGHIHRPQRIGRDTMRYAGSPLKYSASEARYDKSAVLVDLKEKGDITCTLLPLVPLHDVRVITGPLHELVAPKIVQTGDAHDYIYAQITDDTLPLDTQAELRLAYPNLIGLEHRPASRSSDTFEPLVLQTTQARDPLALFEQFFLEQNQRELTDDERALTVVALSESREPKN